MRLAILPAPASAEPALLVSRKYPRHHNPNQGIILWNHLWLRKTAIPPGLTDFTGDEWQRTGNGRAAKCLFSENGGDIGHTPDVTGRYRTGREALLRVPVPLPARRSLLPAVPDAGTDD